MKLKCENIGKLKSAEVEINTITVIAGLNSTGKSTTGKLLYSFFNSFCDIKKESKKQLLSIIEKYLDPELFSLFEPTDIETCANELFLNRFCSDKTEIKKIITSAMGEEFLKNKKDEYLAELMEILNISDDEIYKLLLQKNLYREFDKQINNYYFEDQKATITLSIANTEIGAIINNNVVEQINNFIDLRTQAIYIDDPFILDSINNRRFFYNNNDHKADLNRKLRRKLPSDSDVEETIKEIILSKKIDRIYSKIDSVCNGNLIQNSKSEFIFQFENTKKNLRLINISAGLKAFAILKTLLLNGTIEQKGTIILDEPEIHLHPQWQKLLAEVIVLIQKEFDMHILINSHSPYFISAIDAYTQLYKIRNSCRFYLSKENKDGSSTLINTSNDLTPIYDLLYQPMEDIDNILNEENLD